MSFLIFQMLMLSSACLLDFSSSAMLPPAPQSAAPAHGLARRQSSATSRRLHSKSGKSASLAPLPRAAASRVPSPRQAGSDTRIVCDAQMRDAHYNVAH